ncbi:hypothetical protein [Mycobacterium gallinarum]|uniref:hypothetical protein n=1 Tax=Mycobacterium gallinarum TaxID=39689 RepID=UPI001E5AE885|nr:hypothetical protein [Mycobacterium gallinarum]
MGWTAHDDAVSAGRAGRTGGVLRGTIGDDAHPPTDPGARPATAEPFALPTVAIDWMRRPAYAVVPRQELSRDRARQLRWLDLHMGPVTFQILDQAGGISAVELLTTAHRTGVQVFLDGPDFAADPRERDYAPPNG